MLCTRIYLFFILTTINVKFHLEELLEPHPICLAFFRIIFLLTFYMKLSSSYRRAALTMMMSWLKFFLCLFLIESLVGWDIANGISIIFHDKSFSSSLTLLFLLVPFSIDCKINKKKVSPSKIMSHPWKTRRVGRTSGEQNKRKSDNSISTHCFAISRES